MSAYDLVIKGGTAVTPAGVVPADIAVRGGRIAAIGDIAATAGGEVFDARGLHVLPGCSDPKRSTPRFRGFSCPAGFN